MNTPAALRQGATLLESLLTIALIAVLVALLAPSTGRVRFRAMEDRSLANCRSHAQVLTLYATDFRDTWPYLTSPTATASVIRCQSRNEAVEAKYFDAHAAWNIGLADGYYSGKFDDLSFSTPWTPGPATRPDYLFPCSFIADPRFFRAETEEQPPLQLRPTHTSEVAFPSAKALVVAQLDASDAPGLRTLRDVRFHLAGVDGHAVAKDRADLSPSFGGDGAAAPTMSDHLGRLYAGPLHTLDGIAGRDLRE